MACKISNNGVQSVIGKTMQPFVASHPEERNTVKFKSFNIVGLKYSELCTIFFPLNGTARVHAISFDSFISSGINFRIMSIKLIFVRFLSPRHLDLRYIQVQEMTLGRL